jgi:PhnB protein
MGVLLNPYLSFRDTALAALEYYHGVFGGTLTTSTFGEFGASDDPAEKDKVMHGQLDGDNGLTLMASDTPNSMPYTVGNNITVSLSGDDADALRGYWEKLSDGGTIQMPLAAAPWGDTFGMCQDRFGVGWLVNIAGSARGGAAPADQ